MNKSQNILISPLNWGLGHASRIIPIIDYCLNSGKNVIIAGNGASLDLLKNKYPDLTTVNLPAPTLHYGNKRAISIRLVINVFFMLINLCKERRLTKRIIRQYNIDTIISDNRPGVYSSKVKSIYITHQLSIFISARTGLLSAILSKVHQKIIAKYDYCWVPDFEGENSLAGRLSSNVKNLQLFHIGPLSRFATKGHSWETTKTVENKIVCILSGPEPQRSAFETHVISKLQDTKHNSLIIRGLPNLETSLKNFANVSFLNHCDDNQFYNYLQSADLIICRSGYSSIMDIFAIGKNALIIPTPGQPEQEYLAKYLSGKYGFIGMSQNEFAHADLSTIEFPKTTQNEYDGHALKKILDLHL